MVTATATAHDKAVAQDLWRTDPHTYAHVASDGDWLPYPHLKMISEQIADALKKGGGRLLINCPAAHGKSELIGRWVPAWAIDRQPDTRVIYTSYSKNLCNRVGRSVRDHFAHSPHALTKLRADTTSVAEWYTTEGGGMYSASIGGQVTGFHGHLLLMDDAYANKKQAYSLTWRREVVDFFNGVLYKRQMKYRGGRDATIVVLMTRWHPRDLGHYLLHEHPDKWTHIKLPALANQNDPLGRPVGMPLCPALIGADQLRSDRKADPFIFEAMGQQEPDAIGAGRAYKHFAGTRNIDKSLEMVDESAFHVSFDFNLNPGMHAIVGQYRNLGDRDLFTAVHEIHRPRMDTADCVRELVKLIESMGGVKRWPEIHLFGDATSNKRRDPSASESGYGMIRRVLRSEGFEVRTRTPRGNPGVRDSLDAYNDALYDADGIVRYMIHPRCERLLADMRELMTDQQGLLDKADENLSHASDAERYRVFKLRPCRDAIGLANFEQ